MRFIETNEQLYVMMLTYVSEKENTMKKKIAKITYFNNSTQKTSPLFKHKHAMHNAVYKGSGTIVVVNLDCWNECEKANGKDQKLRH